MMTRKDYILVSEGLRNERNAIQDSRKPPTAITVLVDVAEMLADLMEEDNDNFDRDMFMTNSGLSTQILEAKRK